MEKIFRSTLRHHSCLIKLPLLQLHHHTLLIKLTYIASLHNIPYTCPLIKLTIITSLRHYCYTCVISNLHCSNIIPHCFGSTHLIPPEFHSIQLKFTLILFSQTFTCYSIFNYIWNTSKLLHLFGNVEINPGPRPIDQNPVFCTICSRKINRGLQQDMAPTCSNENLSAQYHQACNGLSTGQTCHAKDSGCSIIWKCPQHGSGIVEVIIPPTPVYEQPNRPSAVGKSCSVCVNPIHTRYADLAYHCASPSSDNFCHLAAMCSRFVYPRGNARPRALSTRIWHCHLHSTTPSATSPSAMPHLSSLANNSPPRPNPPSLMSLLNQGLSLADEKNLKEKCAKCSAALRSNTVPVRCSVCSKGFHQKCSTGPKASTCDNLCEKCTNIQQNCTSQSTNHGPTNSLPSQPVPSTTRNKLKIYQWNADSIRPKLLELRDRLLNSDIDVLAVQESKLQKTDKTPSIEGHATIRKDRNNILGGGLLLFI